MADAWETDYIIVGAGSAGCVLANRLSADPAAQVLLLEAGGDDRPLREPRHFWSNLMIHVPAGFANTITDPRVNWLYRTAPDPSTGGRVYTIPRGKTLGGSSSINGMVYIRGQQADYDYWNQIGCRGWSWDSVRPYFLRAENREQGPSEHHAVGGPLHVADIRSRHPVSEAAIAAAVALGVPQRDVNGGDQEGVCYYQQTMRGRLRCSAAAAYLHPIMRRSNLRVEIRALVTRIVVEHNRAVGVAFVRDGINQVVRARREVILCGGAVNSPQILQLSGIGPGALLQRLGVPVIRDSAEVGENLQDHYITTIRYNLKHGVKSINEQSHGVRFLGEAFRYLIAGKGLLSLPPAQLGIFVRSRPDLAGPDMRFHVMPATVDVERYAREGKLRLERSAGLTIAAGGLRPESRGHVRIVSTNPRQPPEIVPNFLSDPLDQDIAVRSLQWARALAAQDPLRPLIADGPMFDLPLDDYETWLRFARERGVSDNHLTCTCRMGSDEGAVVDPDLRVRGVEGLRVADASIMPRLVSGNTNAPVIMIAEKAADMILGRVLSA